MSFASDELPDPELLEWLGLIADVEDLGVDVDTLIDARDDSTEEQEQEEEK